MLNLILFGPPGSGKGTQADKLKVRYNLLHMSTGEVIRAEIARGSGLGEMAARQMKGGGLASDRLVCGIIGDFIKSGKDTHGVIFDGFPRTIPQAEEFDEMLESRNQSVTLMVALDVPDDEVVSRIKSRAEVSGRADDQDEKVIRKRIEVYKKQTTVVAEYYKAQGKFYEVDGVGSVDSIFENICEIIDKLRNSE